MNKIKLYYCEHCHNVAWKVHDSGQVTVCCGDQMHELIPEAVDAAREKHVPVIKVDGNIVTVKVGEVAHPMLPEHFIGIVALQTGEKEVQFVTLEAGEEPIATFAVKNAGGSMYAYDWCNLHGLWIAEK